MNRPNSLYLYDFKIQFNLDQHGCYLVSAIPLYIMTYDTNVAHYVSGTL